MRKIGVHARDTHTHDAWYRF